MSRKPARENVEIRVLSTGKGWRVDIHEIGALVTRTAARPRTKHAAMQTAFEIAGAMQLLDYYGFIRVMVQMDRK